MLPSFRGPSRALHLTTLAFFLSFVVWFDMAPFAPAIKDDLGLTDAQMVTLALCNLALTVPARVLVGVAARPRRAAPPVRRPPRRRRRARTRSSPCRAPSRCSSPAASPSASSGPGSWSASAWCRTWFPARRTSAPPRACTAAGATSAPPAPRSALPGVASLVAGGAGGWRWGIGVAGVVAAVYGVVYWFAARTTHPPAAAVARRPARSGSRAVRADPRRGVGPRRPAGARGRRPRRGGVADRGRRRAVTGRARRRARRRWRAYLVVAGARWCSAPTPACWRASRARARLPVPLGGAPVARLRRHLRCRAHGRLAAPDLLRRHLRAADRRGQRGGQRVRVHEPRDPARRRPRLRRHRAAAAVGAWWPWSAPRPRSRLLALLDGSWPLAVGIGRRGAGVGVRAGRQRRRVRHGPAGPRAGRAARSPGWPAPTATSAASPSRRSCSSPTTTPRSCSSCVAGAAAVVVRSCAAGSRRRRWPVGRSPVAGPREPGRDRLVAAGARRGLMWRWSRRPASSRPIRPFVGVGLDEYQAVRPAAVATRSPRTRSAQCVYFRGGNSSDDLVCVVLTRDGEPDAAVPHRGARLGPHPAAHHRGAADRQPPRAPRRRPARAPRAPSSSTSGSSSSEPSRCRGLDRRSCASLGGWPRPSTRSDHRWYQRAVFYEVLVRGFFDSTNDGTGDLQGLIAEARPPRVARHRLPLAAAVLRVAAARRRLRHQRLLLGAARLRRHRRRRAS